MTITLRIKRVYFDAIAAGTKSIEYRDVKPFYDKLLSRPNITHLKLHYQQPRQMICEVRGIFKKRVPPELRNDPDVPFSEYVYAIMLANPKLIIGRIEKNVEDHGKGS